jgi:hypothetical protein
MTLSVEQRRQFEEASRPLMRWLGENCHPHATVIVDSGTAELVEGAAVFNTEEYIRG